MEGDATAFLRLGADKAVWGSATQHEVYEASVRPVIEGIIDGINATIFA